MANQRRLWNDPAVRAEREAAVAKVSDRPMELDPIEPEPPAAPPPPKPKKAAAPKREATTWSSDEEAA